MEGIIFLVIILAAAHAIDNGRAFAWDRTKTATRSRWQAYTEKRPSAGRGSQAGVATGQAIGAAAVGLAEGIRGFAEGARLGWGEGRDKAYAWHDRRRTNTASALPEPAHAAVQATGTHGSRLSPRNGGEPADSSTRPQLHLVDHDQRPDTPVAADSADGNGAHGLNERLRVKSVYDGRDFLYQLVKIYADQK